MAINNNHNINSNNKTNSIGGFKSSNGSLNYCNILTSATAMGRAAMCGSSNTVNQWDTSSMMSNGPFTGLSFSFLILAHTVPLFELKIKHKNTCVASHRTRVYNTIATSTTKQQQQNNQCYDNKYD